jgi:hypothetical protein
VLEIFSQIEIIIRVEDPQETLKAEYFVQAVKYFLVRIFGAAGKPKIK